MRVQLALLALVSVLLVAGCGSRGGGLTQEECNRVMDKTIRSQCMLNMSITNKNPAYCKDIPDLETRRNCIDEISMMLGQDMYCINHEKLSGKEECERKVAAANKQRKLNATQ